MDNKKLIKLILSDMYKIISSDDISSYAFKGGYVLSKIFTDNLRSTGDIDMSVKGELDFKRIMNKLTPYLDNLKNKGIIYKYVIKMPEVTEFKNQSGGVKLYKKKDENSKAYVLCGVDISIHDLSYGIMTFQGSNKCFCYERMLSDKIAILYKDEYTLVRRCRDLYDIYLFNTLDISLDKNLLMKCLSRNNVPISSISTFEKIISSKNQMVLRQQVESMLRDNKRVDINIVIKNNIDFNLICKSVLYVLNVVRS